MCISVCTEAITMGREAVKSFALNVLIFGNVIISIFSTTNCQFDIFRWARWYLVTFSMSIVWIAGLSYIMVWMVLHVILTFISLCPADATVEVILKESIIVENIVMKIIVTESFIIEIYFKTQMTTRVEVVLSFYFNNGSKPIAMQIT